MSKKPWRVCCKVSTESWVEIVAETAAEAEAEALKRPGVLAVLAGVTIPGDKLAKKDEPTIGVQEDLFWSKT